VKRDALGAIGAQATQALASFVIQVLVAKSLGLDGLGTFSILYGVIVLVTALLTGFVGDSLVVLDRRERSIRSALEQYALGLSVLAAVACSAVAFLSGLVTLAQALLFGLALVLFVLEEMMRRLLMANLGFWRVAAIDFTAFIGMICVVALSVVFDDLTLGRFLLAISVGQVVAIAFGVVFLPSEERFAVAFTTGGHRAVAAYGSWRASQQLLRPALLTAVRTLVTIFLGLAATGLLEAGRVYVAPAMLVVSGFTSFLFVSFAKNKNARVSVQLPKADKAVWALFGITVVLGAMMVLALPIVGRVLFGTAPQLNAVLGWLAYTASVSAVTPYGALAAVGNKQAFVFGIRLTETLVSVLAVLAMMALGADPGLVPIVLAVSSTLGGLAIRTFILSPLARGERGPAD
jgi:O-antigen/teichoic acid export membrane protein